jgi:hypothetical protein
MYNFNGSKHQKRLVAIVALVLIVAMAVTTLVTAIAF